MWLVVAATQNVGRPKLSWNRLARSGKLRDARLRADLSPRHFMPGANDADVRVTPPSLTSPTAQARGHTALRFISRPKRTTTRNAPGMKCRGLRSMTMNHQRHQQRAGSVSDRSFATPIRRSAPSSALRAPSPTRGEGTATLSVRRRDLLTIVLQLQPRYGYCVQNGGGAYIDDRFVRTESLRTKGAYISGSDVRTCNFEAVANLLRLAPAKRHGGRSLQKAAYVRRLSPGRVAWGSVDPRSGVVAQTTPPPAYAAAPLSTGAKTPLTARFA